MLLKMTDEPEDYEGPWPSEGAMTKPTAEQVMQLANEYAHCYSFVGDDTMPIKHRELRAAIEALAAPAAPQQAEPVAWAVFDPSGEAIYAALFKTRCVEYVDNEYRYGHGAAKHWAVRPAFAHPPAAEVQRLREALKPFAAIDLTTNQAVDAMDVLRARRALEGK